MNPTVAHPAPAHTGGCLCGAVRYAASGAPLNVRICHCRICQRATGAPLFARAMFPRAAVTITGSPKSYASSPHLRRLFCATCGTSLFAARDDRGTLSVTLASLDDPGALRPSMHIWTSSQVPWLAIDDDLEHHPEGPPP